MMRFQTPAQGRVFHAAQVVFGPRTESSFHGHFDFYELIGVLHGRGEQRLGTGRQTLQAGDVVLVRPRDQHSLRGLPPDGLTFVNVAFPADVWRGFLDLSGLDPRGRLEHSVEPPKFPLQDSAAAAMRATFLEALTGFQRSPTMLGLLRFWTTVFELAPWPYGERGESVVCPAWLARGCAAMRREENLRGGVPRLLALTNVSAAHLSRSMRRHYGRTPTQFVSDVRLRHAATLLATTTATVTEIAYRCGYSSQSYFTRCFQQANGVSPRIFRRQSARAFVP